MCKCYLSQICFCILIFCKELGLCCMTNLNSNSGSAFSLLRDLDPNNTSLWASVSLTLYFLSISVCLSIFIYLSICIHICVCVYIYKNKGCCFSFYSSQMGIMYMNYIRIWQNIVLLTGSATILNVHSAHCYSKCGPKIRFAYLWNVCWFEMR